MIKNLKYIKKEVSSLGEISYLVEGEFEERRIKVEIIRENKEWKIWIIDVIKTEEEEKQFEEADANEIGVLLKKFIIMADEKLYRIYEYKQEILKEILELKEFKLRNLF